MMNPTLVCLLGDKFDLVTDVFPHKSMINQGYRKSKEFVRAWDLFCTTDLLRYKENPEYRSLTGGVVSIAIFVTFAILFARTIFNTFEKQTIISKTTRSEETTPSLFATQSTPFLFALGINGIDLNDAATKYFNVRFSQRNNIKNGARLRTYHDLVPCNRTVWTQVDQRLGETFDRLGFTSWLCLPPGIDMEFEGKYSSDIFKYIKISVQNCTISAGDTRACIDPSLLSTGRYAFNYYFLNSIINPANSDYLDTYLEDRNYFEFTTHFGVTANIFISTFAINTDESLWPLQGIRTDRGGIVHESAQQFMTQGEEFVQLYLRKSSLSLQITRSFKKYDDTISYLGGLFSSVMVAMLIVYKYNEVAYEVDLAAKIYRFREGEEIKAKSLHFLSFLGYAFYSLVEYVRQPDWPRMKHYDAAREEISKQLDIKLIVKQISFLQDCMNYIFQEHELNCLHLKGRLTLEQAAQIRKRFSFRTQFLRQRTRTSADIAREARSSDISSHLSQDNNSANSLKMSKLGSVMEPTLGRKKAYTDYPIKGVQNLSQVVMQTKEELPEDAEWENGSDISQVDEEEAKDTYQRLIRSVRQVRHQAERGNSRCAKILGSLDELVQPNDSVSLQQLISPHRDSKGAAPMKEPVPAEKDVPQWSAMVANNFDMDQPQ